MQQQKVVADVFAAFIQKLRAEGILNNKALEKLEALLSAGNLRQEAIQAAIFTEDDLQ